MEDELMIEMLSTEEGREELSNCIFDTSIKYLEKIENHLSGLTPLTKSQLANMYSIFEEMGETIPKDKEALLKWVKNLQDNQKAYKTQCRASIEANYKRKISELEEFMDDDE